MNSGRANKQLPKMVYTLSGARRRERRHRVVVASLSMALLQAVCLQAAPQNTESAAAKATVIDRYCVTCHNTRLKTAGLELDTLESQQIAANPEVWEKVVRKIRTGAMPPAGLPRPDKTQGETFAASIETALDQAATAHPNPGRPIAHRLNRSEYTNAVRDVLGLEIDTTAMLPVDESGYGFDNISDVLSVTPGLLDRYMLAARKISRLAVGDVSLPTVSETYKLPVGLKQNDRMGEDLPFGTRGGTAVHYLFPVDGEYVVKVKFRHTVGTNRVPGLGARELIDVRFNGTLVQDIPVGGECPSSSQEPRCLAPVGIQFASEYELHIDDHLEARVKAQAGPGLIEVAFRKRTAATRSEASIPGGGVYAGYAGDSKVLTIASVEIDGPFNTAGSGDTASRQKIFICHPSGGAADEEGCAKRILETLARHAYRRPVTDADVGPLLAFYRTGRSRGTFDTGIQFAIERLLVSPNFLFRIESDPVNAAPVPYRISDLELASRLSFFLWSSVPDDQLIQAAVSGNLHDPQILEHQVRRMLADEKATDLVRNFGAQWLTLRDMKKVEPDPVIFPHFDENLREAMERETEMFLESQFREDRSIADLLSANYTFVNERLAKFYGIPDVSGPRFRRVTITDPTRDGLLGQASILTVTSYPNRTSPTERGKWILSNILGAPPPPPPPNVPSLKSADASQNETIRAVLEMHRKNPVCAGCHARMDPLGFALENFNGIGEFRTRDGKMPVDATGAFPDGAKFNGAAEFHEALLTHRHEFEQNFAEKLLTYALGRGAEYYDMPTIRAILREAAPDYRWSSLIVGIAKSSPFQMRSPQQDREAVSSAAVLTK